MQPVSYERGNSVWVLGFGFSADRFCEGAAHDGIEVEGAVDEEAFLVLKLLLLLVRLEGGQIVFLNPLDLYGRSPESDHWW